MDNEMVIVITLISILSIYVLIIYGLIKNTKKEYMTEKFNSFLRNFNKILDKL